MTREERACERGIALAQTQQAARPLTAARGEEVLGHLYRRRNKFRAGEAQYGAALKTYLAVAGKEHYFSGESAFNLGQILHLSGRHAEGLQYHEQSLAILIKARYIRARPPMPTISSVARCSTKAG